MGEDLFRRHLGPGRRLHPVPFAADGLEAVGCLHGVRCLGGLAVFAGIDTIGQELAGVSAPLAGLGEASFGIDAKGEPLLLAPKSILEPPPLAPAGVTSRYIPPPSASR